MKEYIKENPNYLNVGIKSNYICDISLAMGIYAKIRKVNPDITDEKILKYFKIALDNIRKNKVSEERKANRAKRLNLFPNFNRWNTYDVSKKFN